MSFRKALAWAPWLLLGPLTGPLAIGCLVAWRAEKRWLAGVYALGMASVWFGLPAILARELTWLAALRGA